MLFNYYKDFKGEWLFSLLLSGVQKAGRTHCDHCHRNEFPKGPAPIRAQLCAELFKTMQIIFQLLHVPHFTGLKRKADTVVLSNVPDQVSVWKSAQKRLNLPFSSSDHCCCWTFNGSCEGLWMCGL